MRKGFFRIFVVISLAWAAAMSFILFEDVANIIYKVRMHKKGEEISQLMEKLGQNDLRNEVASAKSAGYSDTQILFFLYGHRDLKERISSDSIKENKSMLDYREEVFKYLSLAIPTHGDYYYDGAKHYKYSDIIPYVIFFIVLPIALIWVLFYAVIWIAAGFRKSS